MNISRNLNLKQYFTDAEDINALMCQLLGTVDGLSLLEPSVGHGALLKGLNGIPSQIDVVDVDETALAFVQKNALYKNIKSHHCNFIDVIVNRFLSIEHEILRTNYDAIISNPPYGLPLSLEFRRQLKKLYPHLYVKESYGLFFIFSILQLRQGGRYVFLIPDTFLTSKNHTPLREFICTHAAPTHIVRFPSKKFETVNFGYGNLCIIAGHKRKLEDNDRVLWLDTEDPKVDVFDSKINLAQKLKGEYLLKTIKVGWSATGIANQTSSVSKWPQLGSLAECRTGIYTGDNVRFIGYDPTRVKRRLNGHSIDWSKDTSSYLLSDNEKLNGIESSPHYVPLIRGGHRGAFERTASAINWNYEAIKFYKTNAKARFQNSRYYFLEGISVPMVSSKRISAALMKNSVFDQGVVGVFPHARKLIAPLLLYLNSIFASKLMKGMVNGSANNSANYLKQLPVPLFNQNQIKRASEILSASQLIGVLQNQDCDDFVESILSEITTLDK